MGNLHLVTGHAGQGHVTAADHGSLNASIFGTGQYVLNRGNKFAATVVSNNIIRIADGDILLQGRHIRLNENSYVDLTIENGAQDMLRNDLIVARYSKDSTSGVEDCNLIVIKGTPASADPVDPEYIKGDLMINHDLTADMPLYRVPLNGLAVQEIVPLFESFDSGFYEHTFDKANPHNVTVAQIGAIPISEKGAANGVATLDENGKLVQTLAFEQVNNINKNLLHNWYFKNPVNSKGLTAYRGINDTFIDRWYSYPKNLILNLTEKGIVAIRNDPTTSQYDSIRYLFDATEYTGKTLTFSLLANSQTRISVIAFKDRSCTAGAGSKAVTFTGKTDLLSFSFVVPEDSTVMSILIYPMSTSEEYADSTTLIAAKIELGSVQTLAQKDENDEWILTEIPDFAEQAAICSQYGETRYDANAVTEEYIGAAKPFALVQNYTASTLLAAGNMGNFLSINSTADLTVTVPLDDNLTVPVGVELEICRYSTGNVTVVGESGVSIVSSSGSTSIGNQYGCVTLKKLAANTWLVSGDLG